MREGNKEGRTDLKKTKREGGEETRMERDKEGHKVREGNKRGHME